MGDLIDLAKRLEAKAAGLGDIGNEAKKTAATVLLDELIDATPVDESTAESNWQVGIGTPPQAERRAYIVGKGGSTAAASAEAAKAAGRAIIAQAKPGQTIVISNLLAYIRRLNDGSSKQAPAGFVQRAIVIAQDILSSVREVRTRK